MKSKGIFETGGAESEASFVGIDDHSVGPAPDEELLKARFVNVRVLGNKGACKKVAVALENLGLVVTAFDEDPLKNPGLYRMFLAGKLGGNQA